MPNNEELYPEENKGQGGQKGQAIAGVPAPSQNITGNNYAVNYNDARFAQVDTEKNQALAEVEQTYGDMAEQTDQHYQAQIDASKQWAQTQTQLQQEQSDFAIEQIQQQKDQAKKDYTKEQSGAYADWQKQSNQYGSNAEAQAAAGMAKTGYAESSQTAMYTAYQNRVAAARESYNQAVLNYDNAMTQARLQNNSALAEIAFNAFQQQLTLALEGFQYKNQLILEGANKKLEVEQMYHDRWQDVLDQINQENAMAEQIRQYEQNYALQEKEYEEGIRQFEESMALEREQWEWEKAQAEAKSGSGGTGGAGVSGGDVGGNGEKPTYTDVKEDYKKLVRSGQITDYGKDKFLYDQVQAGNITAKQAEKIAGIFNNPTEKRTAGDNMWDRHS